MEQTSATELTTANLTRTAVRRLAMLSAYFGLSRVETIERIVEEAQAKLGLPDPMDLDPAKSD